jgi:hypothetical protein
MQSEAFRYYRALAIQVKANFKPKEALLGLKRIEDRATNDATLNLEEKVEFLELLELHRKDLEKNLRV